MSLVEQFESEILRVMEETNGVSNLMGVHVVPVVEMFMQLQSVEEKLAFQKALERLLEHEDPEVRSYGVSICLGFFVFRNSL